MDRENLTLLTAYSSLLTKIEAAIETSGIPCTFLRADFFMQNHNDQHLEEIRDRREIFVPAGREKRNFIDVRDVAEIAAKAFT